MEPTEAKTRCGDQARQLSLHSRIHSNRVDELFGGITDRTAFPASRIMPIQQFPLTPLDCFGWESHFGFYQPSMSGSLQFGVVYAVTLPQHLEEIGLPPKAN